MRSFGALIPLQPVRWIDDGLLCMPDLAAEPTEHCPFPLRAAAAPAVVAPSPARLVSGWYRRSAVHAPAPPGFPELIQDDGEGFGPADHPTTAMCLAALRHVPDGDALDVGCGSGLLTLAWSRAARGPITALDADPRAVRQAQASARLMGWTRLDRIRVGRIEGLAPDALADRVLLANLPPVAHDLLGPRATHPPRAAVLSGFTRRDRERVLTPYRRRGLRPIRAMRSGRFECHVLVGDA